MIKLKLAYLLLIGCSILLVIDIYNLDFTNLKSVNYLGIIVDLLLVFGMIVNIRDLKKSEKIK